MAKLIIFLTGRPQIYGYKRGDFTWSVDHKCYLWKNRILDEREFNEVADKAIHEHEIDHPSVRIVEFSKVAEPPPPPAPRMLRDLLGGRKKTDKQPVMEVG